MDTCNIFWHLHLRSQSQLPYKCSTNQEQDMKNILKLIFFRDIYKDIVYVQYIFFGSYLNRSECYDFLPVEKCHLKYHMLSAMRETELSAGYHSYSHLPPEQAMESTWDIPGPLFYYKNILLLYWFVRIIFTHTKKGINRCSDVRGSINMACL